MPPSYVDVCGKLDTVTVTCFLHTDDFQLGKHNEKEEAHGNTQAPGNIPLHLHGHPASLLGNQLGGGHCKAFVDCMTLLVKKDKTMTTNMFIWLCIIRRRYEKDNDDAKEYLLLLLLSRLFSIIFFFFFMIIKNKKKK